MQTNKTPIGILCIHKYEFPLLAVYLLLMCFKFSISISSSKLDPKLLPETGFIKNGLYYQMVSTAYPYGCTFVLRLFPFQTITMYIFQPKEILCIHFLFGVL